MSRAQRLSTVIILGLSFVAAKPTLATELVIFDGVAQSPFGLFVGDAGDWSTSGGNQETVSAGGFLSVTTDAETGARRAEWNGKGKAQLYLASPEPIDLSASVDADAALVMILSVQQPARKEAILRMGCGYPCGANADISQLLKALPKDELLRVSVDLKCFVDGGLDASKVDTPFLIITDRKMSLTLVDVRIVDGAGPGAVINCR